MVGGAGVGRAGSAAPGRRRGRRRRSGPCGVVSVAKFNGALASTERDDAAYRIVGGNANGDPIAGDDLDAESPHPAAELGKDFVPGVYLHPI